MTVTPPRTPTSPTASATATYVYAVCRAGHPGVPATVRGHGGGGPLRLLAAGAVCALVQDVPEGDFSETALRQRFADPAELEHCARTHHEVVTAATAAGPAVPLPLATLYLGDARAGAALGEHGDRFLRALEHVTGRAEWAVKVHLTQAAGPPRPATPAAGQAVSGRAYLDRLRGRQQVREQHRQNALDAAEQVDRTVRGLAVAAMRRRPHGAEVTGRDRTQIMNAAYLIADDRSAELPAAIGKLQDDPALAGVEIDVSGPWVPYSFTDLADLTEGEDRAEHA
ncbi:GvpL/GvpF family gas vesicle protein [Streptomyces sp. NPDC058045]|uniref:GvpL/GvpF family gas vesicle protein n=1 Tax=Streptomyces sp. NPDC058045 TaxID=3346311 RepID=UPI0036EBBF5D